MTGHPSPSSFLTEEQACDTFNPGFLDEIANAIRGPAVQAAIDARIEQIVRYGHDATHDADLSIDYLPRQARERLLHAHDQLTGSDGKQNLPAARKNIARAAAICLAAIDRLDLVLDAKEREA